MIHDSTFQHIVPGDESQGPMQVVRDGYAGLVKLIEYEVSPGPDREYAIRLLRSSAMWSTTAMLRETDGTPRNGAVSYA